MPHEFTIPAVLKRVCEPCEFHQCTGKLCGPPGGISWAQFQCTHPDAFEKSDDDRVNVMQARHFTIWGGRDIGRTEDQPEWCPLRRPDK
jgi:hypothetical protein